MFAWGENALLPRRLLDKIFFIEIAFMQSELFLAQVLLNKLQRFV